MDIELMIENAQDWEAAGEFDMAESAYREAEELAPDDPRIHNGLGVISMRRDCDPLMAQCWYARAIVNDPLNRDTWSNLAVVHYETNQFHLALSHARIALKLDPKNTEMMALAAYSLDELGACGIAAEWWQRFLLSRHPIDPEWRKYALWRCKNPPAERTATEIRAALLSPLGRDDA